MAMAVCAVLWGKVRRLEGENEAMRRERVAVAAPVVAAVSKGESAAAEEVEAQKLELARLRNEVTQLRASRDAAMRDVEALRKGREGSTVGAASMEGEKISTGDLKFSGYETPQAALLTTLWAMKEGQVPQLLESFTPEERQRFEAQMAGRTAEQIAERFQKEYGRVTGLRVLGQHASVEDEVVLDVYMEGTGRLKKYRVRQVDGAWKAAEPVDQNFASLPSLPPTGFENSMAYYMQNPELMKRYFPQMYEMMQRGQQATPQSGPATEPANPMMYYMNNPELMKRYFPQMYERMMRGRQQEPEAAEGE